MKVAIDGPAGSGKSTLAHALAERLDLTMLDTGAMYRSVTLACLEGSVDLQDDEAVTEVARRVRIEFQTAEDGSQRVILDGRDVSEAIRTAEVDADVSRVSAIPAVREAMVEEQRRLAATGDVVAEGRDIGTVVFPDAEVKVFLTADPEARAHRRALQRNVEDPEEEQVILADLKRRDEADSTRETAPLVAAEDAYRMDTSGMTIEEEVQKIAALVEDAKAPVPSVANDHDEREGERESAPAEVAKATVHDSSAEKPKPAAKKATAGKDASNEDKPTGRMRVFAHHEPDEFYDTAERDFPITSRALLGATIGVCGILSKVLWHWTLEGGEKLWKAKGGQVVVMNHESMLDPVIIVVSGWMHGRRMRPISKSELSDNKIARWFFARVGAIPVERGTADIKAVRRAQRALQRGEDIVIFPEGTRIHSDDQEVTIHGGFALMAQLAKAPVLPIAIVGARDGAPGGNKPLCPGRVYMKVGDPLTFDQIHEKSRKKRAKEMERLAMERVYELRDELRAEHPGKM